MSGLLSIWTLLWSLEVSPSAILLLETRAGKRDRHLCLIPSGMDTQLVVRPLLDKVEKNTLESALRKITFPHVSANGIYLC